MAASVTALLSLAVGGRGGNGITAVVITAGITLWEFLHNWVPNMGSELWAAPVYAFPPPNRQSFVSTRRASATSKEKIQSKCFSLFQTKAMLEFLFSFSLLFLFWLLFSISFQCTFFQTKLLSFFTNLFSLKIDLLWLFYKGHPWIFPALSKRSAPYLKVYGLQFF